MTQEEMVDEFLSKTHNNIIWKDSLVQLLKEERNAVLSEALRLGIDDRDDAEWHMICHSEYLKGFNESNKLWKELINTLKHE